MIDGRYSFEREIARGGTGAVWLGRDELLGRPVALKRIGLLPGNEQPDVARAEREAQLSARLNHPHVVAVFDVVTDSTTGDRWLVMEYVDGVTLGQLVREHGPLAPDEAAALLWQVADALSAAHRSGVCHRDVKPSNVLVDRTRQAKLTDFGIARVATDPSLTQTGFMTGSPAYLAPEVASGGRGDTASDVWSLGATAFEVLAGRPPYEVGDNVLGALYRIVHDEPPRLPDAGWIAPLLDGTMVKDPRRRWSIEQVRDFLAGDHQASPAADVAEHGAAPSAQPVADGHTRILGAIAPPPLPPPEAEPPDDTSWRPPAKVLVGLGAAVLVLLLAVAYSARFGGSGPEATGSTSGPLHPKATSSSTATAGSSPTARGMEAFIRDYVATVAADPDRAWTMLTPKFRRESGGIERYHAFWDRATDGTVLSISADPATLVVSYHVHFDNFDNGPGPTVLELKFDRGRYFIDGERTKGFVPANDEVGAQGDD